MSNAPDTIWGDHVEPDAVQQLKNACQLPVAVLEALMPDAHVGFGLPFSWDTAQRMLRERGVTLLSAGLDEVPMAYKNIDEVMAAQSDLVEPLARFDPSLVKMAPSGEPPEDQTRQQALRAAASRRPCRRVSKPALRRGLPIRRRLGTAGHL